MKVGSPFSDKFSLELGLVSVMELIELINGSMIVSFRVRLNNDPSSLSFAMGRGAVAALVAFNTAESTADSDWRQCRVRRSRRRQDLLMAQVARREETKQSC